MLLHCTWFGSTTNSALVFVLFFFSSRCFRSSLLFISVSRVVWLFVLFGAPLWKHTQCTCMDDEPAKQSVHHCQEQLVEILLTTMARCLNSKDGSNKTWTFRTCKIACANYCRIFVAVVLHESSSCRVSGSMCELIISFESISLLLYTVKRKYRLVCMRRRQKVQWHPPTMLQTSVWWQCMSNAIYTLLWRFTLFINDKNSSDFELEIEWCGCFDEFTNSQTARDWNVMWGWGWEWCRCQSSSSSSSAPFGIT